MLEFKEYNLLSETIEYMDSQLTDEIIDNAEFYEIDDEDEKTLTTRVTLFDGNGAVLTSFEVEDYDMAVEYLQDIFDLEEYEPEEADSQAAAISSRYGHSQ